MGSNTRFKNTRRPHSPARSHTAPKWLILAAMVANGSCSASQAGTIASPPTGQDDISATALAPQAGDTASHALADEPVPAEATASSLSGENAPTELPSPTSTCLDPSADAMARLARQMGYEPGEDLSEITWADLNGDGTPDQIRMVDTATTFARYYLYVMTASCGRFVGEVVVDAHLAPLPTLSHGLADLEGRERSLVGCTSPITVTLFRFDGTQYAEAGQRLEVVDCPLRPTHESPFTDSPPAAP